MKKLLATIVSVFLAALFAVSMTACNGGSVVKIIEIDLTEEEYAFILPKGSELTDTINGYIADLKSEEGLNGVTIDDCEKVNKAIDPVIDELNPTNDEPYTLVVSSPGLDRQLKTDRDLKRTIGKEVTLTLFSKIDGKKSFEGELLGFDEKTVTIRTGDGEKNFDRDKIAGLKLVIKF